MRGTRWTIYCSVWLLLGCTDDTSGPALTPADTPSVSDSDDGGERVDSNESDTSDSGLDTVDSENTQDAQTGVDAADSSEGPLSPCEEALLPGLTWFEPATSETWPGTFEWGQTHVIRSDEQRRAPPLVAERETLLLFSPDESLPSGADVRVAAFADDELLGVVAARAPSALPLALEQSLTTTSLTPYSETAWSATLPWHWMKEGVSVRVGTVEGAVLRVASHEFFALGAPHRTTLSRAKIVLFGEEDFDTRTIPAEKLSTDFFAAVPGAEFRWVNHTPWRLDKMVVNTPDGPRMAHSEAERLAMTSDVDRWALLKHQFTLRLSLANTGRGLTLTDAPDGDSSPYSFGTSVGLGWVRTEEGNYVDFNNAPWAAGWTGWTALWLGECGNTFIHEVGHSLTLEHFTEGTAVNWGIGDEYPQDGTNLVTHPWGYDTTRRQFRTWYRVGTAGPVMQEGELVGKRDPMNGGESANAVTCFPQYTAYSAEKIQAWQQLSPTLGLHEGQPSVIRWNAEARVYSPEAAQAGFGNPVRFDAPVVTLIGTIGNSDEACQTYPPLHAVSGNVFTLPDPTSPDLAAAFTGARWFLRIRYADETVEQALIAQGAVTDTALHLYSLNLDAERAPTQVDLYESPTGYPNLDLDAAVLKHSRTLDEPPTSLPPVVSVGRGQMGNGSLWLDNWCSAEINCAHRRQESRWQVIGEALHFEVATEDAPPTSVCNTPGETSVWSVPVLGPDQKPVTVTIHAQRVVSGGGASIAVPAHDVTPWNGAPDALQSLRVWLPYDANKGLPAGRYQSADPLVVQGFLGEELFSETHISVDFTVHEATLVDLGTEFVSEGLSSEGSSMYYVLQDPTIGPTTRVWWDDGDDLPTPLTVPVVDVLTGEPASLRLDAQKEACGSRWDLNSGQAADWGCSHHVVLRVAAEGNEDLMAGHTYRSPGSHPVVIEGRRWHDPNAKQLIGTFAFEIQYTVPE